jgi:DNA polymerase-3 subunit epsilon
MASSDLISQCRKVLGFDLDDIVVFDTETTGIDPKNDEILSIALCDARGYALDSTLVRPVRHSSWDRAEAINGISPEMVADAPTLDQLAEEIAAYLDGPKLVVGYNVDFDLAFLTEAGVLDSRPFAVLDVMKEFARVHGTAPSRTGDGYKWSKLADCVAYYGLDYPGNGAHDAMNDAIATAWCLDSMILYDGKWAARFDKYGEFE